MTKLDGCKLACGIFLSCAAMGIASYAQVFTTLVSFNGANGGGPYFVSLIQGTDGNLYGTTAFPGTTFGFVPARNEIITLDTCCGSWPNGVSTLAGLVLGTDGSFYGTAFGFDYQVNEGAIFRMNARGGLTTLHRFHSTDGDNPEGALLLAADGNFYGTTYYGGTSNNCSLGCGTVFKITPDGKLTTLHSFNLANGARPVGTLVQSREGVIYGTTSVGGSSTNCSLGCGTIFKITSRGTLTTVHDFDNTDGATPTGGLVQGSNGNFYGTTSQGGNLNCYFGSCGTVFEITQTGTLTTLHSFAGYPSEGAWPYAGLLQATDGNFYGTTYNGGANFNGGTIFKITPDGTLTTLYSFCRLNGCADGARPYGGLFQSTGGILYGVTYQGGTSDEGTIFSLNMGLGPFVTFARFTGKVGEKSGPILGQGLIGTTGVSLNGIPAEFTVISDTLIEATVPGGATTGYVTVTTPSGTLTSNVPFRVIP